MKFELRVVRRTNDIPEMIELSSAMTIVDLHERIEDIQNAAPVIMITLYVNGVPAFNII